MALLVFISLRDSEAWKGKTGLWMPVLSRFYRYYLNPVIRVTENNTCEYVCTHGHPFLYTDVWSTCPHHAPLISPLEPRTCQSLSQVLVLVKEIWETQRS